MKEKKGQVRKKTAKISPDPVLSGAIFFLLAFSLLMIASASMSSRETIVKDVLSSAGKQFIFVVGALIVYYYVTYHFYFQFVIDHIMTILAGILLMLLSTRLFNQVGGAYAWIRIPGVNITIQPSEFAKAAIIMTVAIFTCDIKSKKVTRSWDLLRIPLLTILIFGIIIILYQRDFGSGFAFIGIGSICLLIPENKLYKKWQIFIVIMVVLIFSATIFFMTPWFKNWLNSPELAEFIASKSTLNKLWGKVAYQFYRFISAGDPLWDRFGYSQELLNSLLGIARGNIFGVGLGNSIQKYGYLASADADYIFPVIVEELGLLGIASVFIPYAIILFKLIRSALIARQEKEKVILIGTASYLFIHLFLNIGGVSALIPLTGVPLILISRGGASLVTIMLMLGICH